MLIGVVSDTHGHVKNTQAAAAVFKTANVERVLHCGDIGSVEIVSLFPHWETHFVFGNVDDDHSELQAAIESAGHVCHHEFGAVEWHGRNIAFLHGHDQRRLHETETTGQYDLVCHGHTHVIRLERIAQTLVLNPGAVFRANPHTVAIVDLPTLQIRHVTIG